MRFIRNIIVALFLSFSILLAGTYSGGDGSSGNPYKITTTADLIELSNTSGDWYDDFEQTADITFDPNEQNVDWDGDGTADWDTEDQKGFSPIGNTSPYFKGSYDGDGHKIENIYISRGTEDEIGLFGRLDGEVKNLGLINADITGGNNTAGLAGITIGSISNSYSTGSVSGAINVGGLVGAKFSGSISNSYSTGSVSGDQRIGGLVGLILSGFISNSYSTGSVSGANNVGGLVGLILNGSISSSFWNTETSGQTNSAAGTGKTSAEMTQQATFTNWDFSSVWSIDEDSSYPYIQSNEQIPHPSPPSYFNGGDGTSGDPYQITSAGQLDSLRYYLNGTYFILMNDIDMSGTTENDESGDGWEPIGTNSAGSEFSSYFDGNGHTISNLFIDKGSTNFVGLFGATKDGEIKDLGLVDVDITGQNYTGALVGLNYGTVLRSFSTGSVTGDTYVGGFSGGNEAWDGSPGVITNAYSTASVTASTAGGGFVGRKKSGIITDCFSTGSVVNGGGFTGHKDGGTESDCFWDTQTSGKASSSGSETGKTTAQMKSRSTFASAGWDLNNVWDIIGQNGEHYPKLQSTRMITIDNIGNSNFAKSEARNIAFQAQGGTIAATFGHVDSSHADIPVGGRTIGEYWEIENVTGDTKIRLYYHPDSTNGFSGTPTIYHYDGSDWQPLPTKAEGTEGSLRYVETTNYRNSFSPVTVGDDASPLPVELTYFEGTATEEEVMLAWETATEVNNYGFEIQKSEDRSQNSEWEKVGFVQGHGTTNSPKSYSFTDSELPNVESVDYRLKQIDNDGTFAYSKTVTVELTTITSVEDEEIPTVYSLSQNYPNPFNPATTIKFGLPESGLVDLTVYNIVGQEVTRLVNKEMTAGYHEVQFDASALSSGMYIYRINVGDKFTSIKKMLILK